MSETPLFQNTDDQEAAFAPHQLPDGTSEKHAANVEDTDRDGDSNAELPMVSGAGIGALAQAGGGFGSSTIAGGTPGDVGPAIVGDATSDDTTRTRRD